MSKLIKVSNHPKYNGVFRRKDKQGAWTLFIIYKINGRQYQEKVGRELDGFTKTDAHALRAERIRTAKLTGVPGKLQRRDITYQEAWQRFLNWYIASGRKSITPITLTHKNYILPAIGSRKLDEVTTRKLEALKKQWHQEEGLSKPTVDLMLAYISQVFGRMIRLDLYEGVNPVSRVERFRANRKRERYLTMEDATKLLHVLAQGDNRPAYLQVVLAIRAGLRNSEILRLGTKDGYIDWSDGCIVVKTKHRRKQAKFRSVPMSGTLKAVLQSAEGQLPFKRIETRAIQQAIDSLGFNEGVDSNDRVNRITFYSLRHTFATHLLNMGVSVKTVAELMGHDDLKSTEVYLHTDSAAKKEAVAQLDNKWAEIDRPNLSVVR